MKVFYLASVTLILLSAIGCSGNVKRTTAPLTVTIDHSSRSPEIEFQIIVESEGAGRDRHLAGLNALAYLEPETNANELLSVNLRHALLKGKKVRVFNGKANPKGKYKIRFHMTEFTPEAETTSSGGELVDTVLVPLYVVVEHMKVFSGLAIGGDEKIRTSVISFDVQLVNPDGVVVYSKPHKASFQSKISRTGGWTSLSRSTSFATSSGDDVTKFLADKIAEDIYQILDQNK